MLNGDQENYLIYGDYVYWLAFFLSTGYKLEISEKKEWTSD